MVTPSFDITETDDGFVVKDTTDYSSEQFIGTYSLNDYTTNPSPTPNSEFTTTIITVGSTVMFSDYVAYTTNGVGDVTDAEDAYNYIIEQANETQDIYKARLNKNGSESWRAWRLEFYSFDESTAGNELAVTTTMTPLVQSVAGQNTITFRNLLVVNPQEDVMELGAIAQVDEIEFNYSYYPEGSTITLTFCSDTIVYNVVNTDRDCIIADLIALLGVNDPNTNYYSLDAVKNSNSIILTQTNLSLIHI